VSVFKRGNKWQYDFWVGGKRYRGSIPEARVKAQAERAEVTIRDSVYEGIYGKNVDAPKLRDFIAETFMPWAKTNKRTWVHDEFRSRPDDGLRRAIETLAQRQKQTDAKVPTVAKQRQLAAAVNY